MAGCLNYACSFKRGPAYLIGIDRERTSTLLNHGREAWFEADAAARTGLKYGCAMASLAVNRS